MQHKHSLWQTARNNGLFIATFLGVLLIFFFFTREADLSFSESKRQREAVAESYDARSRLQTVLALHQDLEAGQRGYIITGNPDFLTPYNNASAKIDANLRTFENRSVDQAERDLMKDLFIASREKRQFATETIQLVKDGRQDEAIKMVSEGVGKRAMDKLRSTVEAISVREAQTLASRIEQADVYREQVRKSSLALQTGLLAMLALAGLLISRSRASQDRAHRSAQDMAARQEAIFASAKDGMIVLNPSGSIESLNPAAAAMFGVSADNLLRRDVGTLFEIAPDRGQIESFLRRLKANRQASYGHIQEFLGRRADGTTFPLEVSLSSVYLVNNTLFLAVLRDISERREVEQMKNEFVATVSHELRTPLTSIAGSLGLISGGAAGEVSPKVARLVEIAHSNATRLVRLVNDILDIEKIEAGRMLLDLKAVELAPLLETAVQQSAGFADEFGITVQLAEVAQDAAVVADHDRLIQVVTNLLSNAIKFSPRAETVIVSVRALDRRFRISVADHGEGIADAFKDHIFGKFSQADTSDARKKGGTGLGLSIVREIIMKMDGAVSYETQLGHGTVFHVDLPAAKTNAPPKIPEIIDQAISAARLPIILHVEDDPDMAALVASAFEGKAIVQTVRSIGEARKAIPTVTYAAAILDMGVADGSGTELIRPLRSQSKELPIIIFSAQDMEQKPAEDVDLMLIKSRSSLETLVLEMMRRIGQASPEQGGSA